MIDDTPRLQGDRAKAQRDEVDYFARTHAMSVERAWELIAQCCNDRGTTGSAVTRRP